MRQCRLAKLTLLCINYGDRDEGRISMEKHGTSSDETELEEDLNVSRVDRLPLLDLLLPVHLLLVLKVETQSVAVIVQAKHPGLSS